MAINRQNIEEYYNEDWNGVLDKKSIDILVENTCKVYKLNLGTDALKDNINKPKPLDLGSI